jgi:hypothetical protein
MTVGSCLQVGQAFFGAYVLCFISIFQAVISLFCGLPFSFEAMAYLGWLQRIGAGIFAFFFSLFSFLFSPPRIVIYFKKLQT